MDILLTLPSFYMDTERQDIPYDKIEILGKFLGVVSDLKSPVLNDLKHILINAIVDIVDDDDKPKKFNTILQAAKRISGEDLMQIQMGFTIDSNLTDAIGNTALHLLFSYNSHNKYDSQLQYLARTLLDAGAAPNAQNRTGKTALHIALANGLLAEVELLLNYGANPRIVDSSGNSSLHFLSGSTANKDVVVPLVSLMMKHGCKIDLPNEFAHTPLFLAVCAEHYKCFDALLDQGADVQYRDRQIFMTVLHRSVNDGIKYPVCRSLMNYLNKKNIFFKSAFINARQQDGKTALHLCSRYEDTTILQYLLSNGADVELVDDYGRTAIHYASKYGNPKAFNLLLAHGSNANAIDNDGKSPMEISKSICPLIWWRILKYNLKLEIAGKSHIDFHTMRFGQESTDSEEYSLQIEKMKETKICPNVTVYDLLVNDKTLYKYRKNVEVIKFMKLSNQFPSYREMLTGRYHKVCRRDQLIRMTSGLMKTAIGFGMEETVTDMIFSFVSNKDLHNFIEACMFVNVE